MGGHGWLIAGSLLVWLGTGCTGDPGTGDSPTADGFTSAPGTMGAAPPAAPMAGRARDSSQPGPARPTGPAASAGPRSDDGMAAGAGAGAPSQDGMSDAPPAGPGATDAASPAAGMAAGIDVEPDTTPAPQGASAAALLDLMAYLAMDRGARPSLQDQAFVAVALTAADAEQAAAALWEDRAGEIRATRMAEHMAQEITLAGATLRYRTVELGDAPPTGRDLFISMHGGGSGPASVNDSQWENQVSLASGYAPEHALWVAPRAPTDDWNMWFKEHIDDLFDRLISNMAVFEGIDVNRVYLTGYSAGGDGVYGLAPRTADRWAGAGMSAGHPNGVSIDNMRNVAFALHAGGNDTAFERNLVTQEYLDLLDMLQAADPEGYPHEGRVHPGLPHWMNLADAASIPFLQAHTRSPSPARVVWEQHERTHTRMYWLAVDEAAARDGTRVVASYEDQTVTIEELDGVAGVRIRLSDAMLDLDQPVIVKHQDAIHFEGRIDRTIGTLARTLHEREDPAMVYPAEYNLSFALGGP